MGKWRDPPCPRARPLECLLVRFQKPRYGYQRLSQQRSPSPLEVGGLETPPPLQHEVLATSPLQAFARRARALGLLRPKPGPVGRPSGPRLLERLDGLGAQRDVCPKGPR